MTKVARRLSAQFPGLNPRITLKSPCPNLLLLFMHFQSGERGALSSFIEQIVGDGNLMFDGIPCAAAAATGYILLPSSSQRQLLVKINQ